MKKQAWALGAIMLIGAMTANAADKVYTLQHREQSDPRLYITSVVVSEEQTRVDLEYRSDCSNCETNIKVAAPDMGATMYIQDTSNGKVYRMRGAEGIAIAPDKTFVKAGSTRKFSLYFPPIPMGEFDLLEGATKEPWKFRNIVLR